MGIDLVQDRTMKNNGLNDKHFASLTAVWQSVKTQLAQYLPLQSVAMETYFIDTFEEEWRCVKQQPRINTLIENPIRILPPHVFHGTDKHKKEQNTKKEEENTQQTNKDEEEMTDMNENKQMDQQQLIRKLER